LGSFFKSMTRLFLTSSFFSTVSVSKGLKNLADSYPYKLLIYSGSDSFYSSLLTSSPLSFRVSTINYFATA
jgi:hypothetical protein